jgi:hypothetical protein
MHMTHGETHRRTAVRANGLRRATQIVGVLCVLLAVAVTVHSAPGDLPRIVAIGDIHGDADALVALLKETGLVNDARQWTGGQTVLIQTGDQLDRGTQVRDVMDLLMALEKQAAAAGGKALVLIGNHEAMNATGELRDVAPAAFAAFADAQSEGRREAAWREHSALAESRRAALSKDLPQQPVPSIFAPTSREAWMEAHPPGMLEYIAAFGPDGLYGKWIRTHDASVRLDDTIFLHGGWSLEAAPEKLESANERIRAELARWDALKETMVKSKWALPSFTFHEVIDAGTNEIARAVAEAVRQDPRSLPAATTAGHPLAPLLTLDDWWLFNPNGPLWFRGYATWSDEQGNKNVEQLLNRLGAARIVVGHTPLTTWRITPRFNSRVFMIDTGISVAYRALGGRPSALEIRDGVWTAVSIGDRTAIFDSRSAGH